MTASWGGGTAIGKETQLLGLTDSVMVISRGASTIYLKGVLRARGRAECVD
jgi:hypothetical protein